MLDCQKHHFSLSEDVTYLNCAYMSPLPNAVALAGVSAVLRKCQPHEILPADFFSDVARLKQLFSALVSAGEPARVAVVPSVSYGIACVVKNLHPQQGQNIVTVAEDFPSDYNSWRRLADDSGCELRVVEAPPPKGESARSRGEAWNEKILEAIDSQTVVAAIPHVHWADGTLYDLAAIRQKTRETGAALVVDGTQSVGALPFDVQAVQPDALVCGGYKWLLGPYGMGLAFFGERFDGGTPLEENWINRLNSEDFQGLVNFQPAYKPFANRYGVGESSQFIHAPMLSAAIELLLEWGAGNIQEYCRRISSPCIAQLADLGCQVESERWRGSHLFGVRLPKGADLQALKSKAAQERVFISFRGDTARIAANVWNDERDFEKLAEVFRSVL